MYYIYILYSHKADKYYTGYTTDINLRLKQHNQQEDFNTYTRKYRPWVLKALFQVGDDHKQVISIKGSAGCLSTNVDMMKSLRY